tara:strand:- start:43 stop:447 length:405 start_codon:yes stop_codon:yes gene_type:complete
MNDEIINDNYEKFLNFCDSLNINIDKDNKFIDKEIILIKINNFKTYMRKKTLKMLDEYYENINNDNFVIKLEKIYKCIKKYDNKINFIIDFINDELIEDQNSLFLDSEINLNLDIEIEDIKSNNNKYLDEYKNS